MRLPFVSRRYAEFLEATLARVIAERDTQQARADHAYDNLWMLQGAAPVSPDTRTEMKVSHKEQREVEEQMNQMLDGVDADVASEMS